MSKPMDEQEKRKQLLALADGELEGDEKVAALEQIADDPQAARAVIHQEKLREAVSKSMQASAPAAPQVLRNSVAAIANEANAQPLAQIGPGSFARWSPAIAAALLLAGSVALYYQMATNTGSSYQPRVTVTHSPARLLSNEQMHRFSNRHEACASMRDQLHEADWPTRISELPVALSEHLGASTYRGLDLTAAGYEFAGAGPCRVPGEPSAHLIYRPAEDQNLTPISLWMRLDDGRFDIPENRTHMVKTDSSTNPILIWRHSGIIYYIVGDAAEHLEKAHGQLTD